MESCSQHEVPSCKLIRAFELNRCVRASFCFSLIQPLIFGHRLDISYHVFNRTFGILEEGVGTIAAYYNDGRVTTEELSLPKIGSRRRKCIVDV
jgi:hypothetical protein